MHPSRFGLAVLLLFTAGCGATADKSFESVATTESEIASLMTPDAFSEKAWTLDLTNLGLVDEGLWVRDDLVLVQARDLDGDDRSIVALGLGDGSIEWVLKIPEGLSADPASGSGLLAFVCGSTATVVDASNGARVSIQLQYDLDFYASGSPAVSRDSLYVPSYLENRVESVLLSNGRGGWHYQCGDLVTAAPVVCGDDATKALVIASSSGEISGLPLRSASGVGPTERLWSRMISGENKVDPIVRGETVYVAAGDTFLYCMNGLSGSIYWKTPCESHFVGPLGVSSDACYVETKTGFVALDISSGAEKWRAPGLSRFVADLGDRVVILTREGSLSIRAKDSGDEYECLQPRGLEHFATNSSSNHMVAGDGAGRVVSLN